MKSRDIELVVRQLERFVAAKIIDGHPNSDASDSLSLDRCRENITVALNQLLNPYEPAGPDVGDGPDDWGDK